MNTRGSKGRNIPCDLHNEHVNKQFKDIILGANFTEIASTRLLVQERQGVSLPLLTWSSRLILR